MLGKVQKNLLIPLGVAVALIATMTVIEAQISDRFTSSSINAADFVARFEHVPESVGMWRGINNDVDDQVRETAGAVGHVSRTYTNAANGKVVDLWLIVGHARDIVRHTPNICYRTAGFRQIGTTNHYTIDAPGEESATFYTAQFLKEDAHSRSQMRVFWAWNGNEPGKQRWDAPDSPRIHYGNNRALYKIYFTTPVMDDEEEVNDSVAVDFAKEMLPLVNAALFPKEGAAAAAGGRSAEDPAARPAEG